MIKFLLTSLASSNFRRLLLHGVLVDFSPLTSFMDFEAIGGICSTAQSDLLILNSVKEENLQVS